ncbi:AlkZ family DNA glycosylase [Spirosoma sp. BT702]|uniref:AlkZ family DNA glycosylase n=1 Tax=Spirosoma profusum TaxID=2771354 RepID=A0A927AUE7_9BACT|nr:winged helix DNA-binding domain-containing protein [Spirosoma profusum]MBD2703917.1 AlkZ family DNA glycosylase [Spirosoma profusum]
MNVADIAKHRFVSQQFAGTDFKTASELVSWLGAVQGQEYAQSKWGLGLRLPHLTDAEIEQDFTDGTLLRTHMLRPTWHVVAAPDIRWMLQLTAPRVHVASGFMYRKLELDTSLFNRCNDLMIRELEGGKHLTRDTLNQAFKRNGIDISGFRLSYVMMNAELEGLICSGARQGNQFTYALLDERVAPTPTFTKEEALAELARRYFTSRGPATLADFATWSGLTLTDCRKGVQFLDTFLKKFGDYYFTDVAQPAKPDLDRIHLLPVYDEFIMGYKDRSASMIFRNGLPQTTISFDNLIMADGQIIGAWKRNVSSKTIEVTPNFFESLTDSQRNALTTSIQHLQRFTGRPVTCRSSSRNDLEHKE